MQPFICTGKTSLPQHETKLGAAEELLHDIVADNKSLLSAIPLVPVSCAQQPQLLACSA